MEPQQVIAEAVLRWCGFTCVQRWCFWKALSLVLNLRMWFLDVCLRVQFGFVTQMKLEYNDPSKPQTP